MRNSYLRYLILTVTIASFFWMPDILLAQAGPGPGGGLAQTTLTIFETDDFSGSGICAMCHSGLTDEEPKDVSNDAHWRSTMMANAAKDPLWQAKISSEVDRNPHVQEIIEEKCSRCHMGMARYQAKTDGTPVEVLGPGFLDPAHYLHEAAMDGVSCTLCHQVQPDGLGTPDSFTGKYVIDTATFPPDRLIFGPYDQVLQNPDATELRDSCPPSRSMTEPHLTDSAHCGSCHTLYTPVLDANGAQSRSRRRIRWNTQSFPSRPPTWSGSTAVFTETCQDCHLPDAVGSVVISNRPRNGLRPEHPSGSTITSAATVSWSTCSRPTRLIWE